MGKLLNVSEVIRFAIRIEQEGYRFYVEFMKKIDEPGVLKLFQYLADEEFKHEHIFRNLLDNAGHLPPPERYRGEYETLMEDFLKGNIFDVFRSTSKNIHSLETLKEALAVALDLERNSIVFYTALKKYVGEENQALIEKIIQEELNHILRIYQYH